MDVAVVEVAAAAIVRDGRVLAARRTHPADVAGGWELPGGKLDPGESVRAAVAREVREELGCEVELVSSLEGSTAIKPGYRLTAHVVRLVSGEPVPVEHDAIRWLSAEELDDVAWLAADLPFLDELRTALQSGERLPGGRVGGAVRVGRTVRRTVGPWTPPVHALLAHLARAGLAEVPRVIGTDAQGREALSFIPGRVVEVEQLDEAATDALITEAGCWLRRFHAASRSFAHPGPWRNTGAPGGDQIVCHHDFAPYNVSISSSANGDRIVGVFDWDMAGAGYPIDDVAFAAWNWIPLRHPVPDGRVAAHRLRLLAAAYGSDLTAAEILDHVPTRIRRSIRVVRAGARVGDQGMRNLLRDGHMQRTEESLALLTERIPAIRDLL